MEDGQRLISGGAAGDQADVRIFRPSNLKRGKVSDFKLFSHNGKILPVKAAKVSLFNIEYSYGFGIYETMKLRHGRLYFVDQHLERLFHSAAVIGVDIGYPVDQINRWLAELVEALSIEAANLKILVIGGKESAVYIFASAPLYPDKKLYRQGVKLISYPYERLFPTAKTLNMLPSYLAYKKAQESDCYDALLIDAEGNILEGTRTNFCLVRGQTIYRAPADRVLGGVTFLTLEIVAKRLGWSIVEQLVPLKEIADFEAAFVTSTSTKIMPVKQIDDHLFPPIPEPIFALIRAYDNFLAECRGVLPDAPDSSV